MNYGCFLKYWERFSSYTIFNPISSFGCFSWLHRGAGTPELTAVATSKTQENNIAMSSKCHRAEHRAEGKLCT